VTRSTFEQRLLEMWVTTRVPMTRANIQFFTKAKREQVDKWLDKLVGDGVIDVDSDDEGEMVWAVRGAQRSTTGPYTLDTQDKLVKLRGEAGIGSALSSLGASAMAQATGLGRGRRSGGESPAGGGDRKSLVASGALSFFFGPLGWLYAAPLSSALPAIIVYMVAFAILPHFLLAPILGLLNPVCALAGVAYALRYNQKGERTPLLGSGDERPSLPPRR
jgi:hypothetical protein